MRRAGKITLIVLAVVIGVPVIAVLALLIYLNTGAGRQFAANEIGKLTGGEVKITRLAGHFPKDIRAKRIEVADAKGGWLTLNDVALRWSPLPLLHRELMVEDLKAASIDVARLPVSAKPKPKKKPSKPPIRSAVIRHIEIGRLNLAKPVAGQAAALRISGHVVAPSLQNVSLALDATSLIQPGQYVVDATLTPSDVNAHISVHEPQGGLIETAAHLPKLPKLQGPLALNMTLSGPRKHATLNLKASLAALQANAEGTVNLSQSKPWASITLTLPHLSPYAAIGKTQLNGSDMLRLTAFRVAKVTTIVLNNTVAITGGKAPLPKLLGHQATLSTHLTLAGNTVTIHDLNLAAAAVTAQVKGTVSKQDVALDATLHEPDISLFDPKLSGQLSQVAHITGPRTDLAVDAKITGAVATGTVPSGPFQLVVKARHLPKMLSCSITGTGSLDDAPLALNADFARAATGAVHLAINTLSWKSLTGSGVIDRAPGEKLPTGTLQIAIAHLSDFAKLASITLGGSINTQFEHKSGQPAALTLTAANIREGKTIGVSHAAVQATLDHISHDPAIDAKAVFTGLRAPSAAGSLNLTAKGTEAALGIAVNAAFSNLAGSPARLALTGMVNGKTRVVHLATLHATARGLAASLLRPATLIATPQGKVSHIAVHHLALGLAGGTITVNGDIQPALNLTASISHLPASIARAADPKLAARGVINATAHLTGSLKAPQGKVTLAASGIGVASGPGAGLPPINLTANETLLSTSGGTAMRGTIHGTIGPATRLDVSGTTPLKTSGPLNLSVRLVNLPLSLAHAVDPKLNAAGAVNADAHVTGTIAAPRGAINVNGQGLRLITATTASLPPASLIAHETLLGTSARGNIRLTLGNRANLLVNGTAPLTKTGPINLAVTGRTDLRLLDPILAAQGTRITGFITPDLRITGTASAPLAHGQVMLANGSAQNVTSGLDLANIDALVLAAGQNLTLSRLYAKAGNGTITGTGTISLTPPMPVNIRVSFNKASPVQSDIISEVLSGGVAVQGAVKGSLGVAGKIYIDKAAINIPKGLPPSVTKLTILKPGEAPPKPSTPPPIALNLTVATRYQGVLVRGDGIFAMLGGTLHLGGTAAKPIPSGGFKLIRGHFNLAGKTLDFTKGLIDFNGNGFMPALDFAASNTASDGTTATLAITGTAAHPLIGLSSNPTLPSDEVLAHLLYGTGTQSLTAFQAASLAASLAQLAGVGGGGPNPIASVRNALGLDELSVGGGSNGAGPSVNAGRYVAPGVYVGATQSTSGGSKAKVEVNLYKGLKLKTELGSGGGYGTSNGNSVGLTYRFNY
jgi:translocation and assembly module TamB